MPKFIGRFLVVLVFGWCGVASAVPIMEGDVVEVNGVEWAQPNLFTDLRWHEIRVVCPTGVCEEETLNGWDMDGWTWASPFDVADLFSELTPFGGGVSEYFEEDSTWAPAFFDDVGFRTTSVGPNNYRSIYGWTSSNPTDPSTGFALTAQLSDAATGLDRIYTNRYVDKNGESSGLGSWFYRAAPTPEMPTPATIPLLGIALAALGFSRRR